MPEKREFNITDATGGAAFAVRVITRAESDEIVGFQEDGMLKVRLMADDASNDHLIEMLAQKLGVDAARIDIVSENPKKRSEKMISVEGMNRQVVEDRLQGKAD